MKHYRTSHWLLFALAWAVSPGAAVAADARAGYLRGKPASLSELKQVDPHHPGRVRPRSDLTNAAKWYNDSVFYHVWLDGFCDSDGDGFGDLRGVLNHLDYLNDGQRNSATSLGVTALWLSPFFEADTRHHYDAKSYYKVDAKLGDLSLLQTLLREAHRRSLRVIFDMVPNHCSSRHPYFLNARAGSDALLRDFYVWTNALPGGWHVPWGSGNNSSRVWARTENGFYYGAFGAAMPDFNYRNPLVVEEMENVMRFYLNLGFDGIRLDAIRYLVEEDNSKAADALATHQVLKEFRTVTRDYPGDPYLVGEVWTSNEVVKTYYGDGRDELTACFNFQFTGSVAKSIENADGDALDGNIAYLCTNLPPGCFPANFLVNHDNAGSRSMTRYRKEMQKIRLAVALNLLEFGTPYIYYGEEIGMEGQSGNDRNMRRPFLWQEAQAQVKDPQSLLSWHRNMIRVRLENVALRHGGYRRIATGDPQVYAFVRDTPQQKVLCVFNLNTKAGKPITLNLERDLVSTAYPIVGTKGDGTPAAYKIALKPGEVAVLSLDVEAKKVCETPEN
jgi:alpha-amylase